MITPQDLLAKADRALQTAENNLRDGDPDAAAGRAYYAVFNAARAALAIVGGVDPESIRTHSGLIARFSAAFVKTGVLDADLGRAFVLLGKDRAVADYDGRTVGAFDAERDVELARRIVSRIKTLIDEHAAL